MPAAAAAEAVEKKTTAKKKGKVGAPTDDEEVAYTEVVKALAKLSLNNAQQLRQLMSATFTTFLVRSSPDSIMTAAEAEGRAYDRTAKEEGGAGLGPPHLHIAAAVVDVMVADAQFRQGSPEHHKVMVAVQEAGKKDLNDSPFAYMRIKQAFKKPEHEHQLHKITWAVDPLATRCSAVAPAAIQQAMVRYIQARCQDPQAKLGPPPKHQVERAVERILRKVS